MEINVSKALSLFYPTSSFEMVFFEAVANALDANASEINISIQIEEFSKKETLLIVIDDNGDGFNETNFNKFTRLLETENIFNKGLGRLVYLKYFDKVDIESVYGNQKRFFRFSEAFKRKSKIESNVCLPKKTSLHFDSYRLDKIGKYDYLIPSKIKKSLLLHFFPRLFLMKSEGVHFLITISLITQKGNPTYGFHNDEITIAHSDIPELRQKVFPATFLDIHEKITMYYAITYTGEETNVTTALCVDNRTVPIDDIINKDLIPFGYNIVFIFYSDYFNGKSETTRQKMSIEDSIMSKLKSSILEHISRLLDEHVPQIKSNNIETQRKLLDTYPHLNGFFEQESLGLIDRERSLAIAQKKYFSEQRAVLEAQEINDEIYEKSIDVASRALTEYILYRSTIIKRLKEVDHKSPESVLHNLIAPQRITYCNSKDDLFKNNAWLLDDKYMTYRTILSEQDMSHLLKEINIEGESPDTTRPDIALVFSADPTESEKFDVVIVELKKIGEKLAKKEEVVSQLKQRARKLCRHYPDKIQRLWFYGIVDIDTEFRISLKEDKYAQLYSKGEVFYKEETVIIDEEKEIKININVFITSYGTLISDAESRNSTFINIIKNSMKVPSC